MDYELKRPYPRVRLPQSVSYGGNQAWSDEKNFRDCGCGIVACTDTLLYLDGCVELTMEEYRSAVQALRSHFHLLPALGIDGVRLALGMNACLQKRGIALRAGWKLSRKRFWGRLEEQLSRDLPAIIAIGPNFPKLWGDERIMLYRAREEGGYAAAVSTRSHFLAVTGLDSEWMRVSSWGRELYIAREAYARYQRLHGAWFSNLLYLRDKN